MIESKTIKNFQKILIANRGEIAIRIIRTAKKLGLKTVAIYSDEDIDSPHLSFADEKINIGSGSVSKTYLSIKKIIDAAKKTKSDIIHPGYGFLSENANFAKKCLSENLLFIGPDFETIKIMGDKKIAKNIAIRAGVPCLPDFKISPSTEFSTIIENANKIGFPIMIKATKGGGGKGMRLVKKKDKFKDYFNLAKSESFSSFGSDEIIIEKAVLNCRHIEVQIFGDNFGNIIHLGERDCSIQRRHQKIIEEAPASGIKDNIRNQLANNAIKLAREINYKGAGTVEFLLDENYNFFFLEMNTRLQVEHPVTEMITNLDLVELQFLVADNQKLPLNQEMIKFKGHAIEARLYAEDPSNNFLPCFGKILEFDYPSLNYIRIDNGIKKNQTISSFFDPMLCKVISFSNERLSSINQLKFFLTSLSVIGLKTNRDFLIDILAMKDFAQKVPNTSFIVNNYPSGVKLSKPHKIDFAVFAYFIFEQKFKSNISKTSGVPKELWNWSNIDNLGMNINIECFGNVRKINIKPISYQSLRIVVEEKLFFLEFINKQLIINKDQYHFIKFYSYNDVFFLVKNNAIFDFFIKSELNISNSKKSSGEIFSPMHGIISDVKITKNNRINKGDTLLILEAMKMQHEISSDIDGIIDEIVINKGSQVSTGDLLIKVKPDV